MNEAWAAIIAAVAAGVFGIAGILLGIVVGRRQTVDQATVEHGQWLRGQRQQAYADVLTKWDVFFDAADDYRRRYEYGIPEGMTLRDVVQHWTELQGPRSEAQEALETAMLLGPQPMVVKAGGLREIMDAVFFAIPRPAALSTEIENMSAEARWTNARRESERARTVFREAAMRVLRTPPAVSTEDGLL
ncbi:hypothetical protein [Streptomyces sp. NPDC008150]|uniref:hypothetical protein n=1 Tax=Streptomyces sp. NPDC008150 TaxID=3364816 RepID=UPI0036E2F78F